MSNDLLYNIALTLVPNIGDVYARLLLSHFGDAASIFRATKKQLELVDGMGDVRAGSIKKFNDFGRAEEELAFIEKYKIDAITVQDNRYPQRMLNCYDSPTVLYFRGNADLNAAKTVSIVGTRSNSEYGKHFCDSLIADLANEQILIVSGLAFGIDTIAHKAALKNNLPTVAVLAHGLDAIYPSQNKLLAKEMIEQGGLLTDYLSATNPDKQNFPKRNRIVAGMCDALIVVESSKKGGSLITAELANGYNKDVFAVPGKTTDLRSEGCNYLIKSNRASLISNADDLLSFMNWKPAKKKKVQQRQLFIELTAEEKAVVELLQKSDQVQIDEIYAHTKLSSSAVAQALLMLEMQGIIESLPGKVFKLL